MTKSEARKHYRQLRAGLSNAMQTKLDDLLLIQFQQLSWAGADVVLSFYPSLQNKEADSFILTKYLSFINPALTVAYPKINESDNSMEGVVPATGDSFAPNSYGIMEPVGEVVAPEEFDAVLVPMLGFDEQGNRVGYGKGYYDRFLQRCTADCIKAGICYFAPVPLLSDTHSFDVPLDFCITPQQLYVF